MQNCNKNKFFIFKQKQAEKKFAFERKMCKETKYADVYFTAQKVSPYSNKFK